MLPQVIDFVAEFLEDWDMLQLTSACSDCLVNYLGFVPYSFALVGRFRTDSSGRSIGPPRRDRGVDTARQMRIVQQPRAPIVKQLHLPAEEWTDVPAGEVRTISAAATAII